MTAVLIVSHGSPRAEANQGFIGMVHRITERLGSDSILPAFFSIARPNIADQVAVLAERGATRIILMPYFLFRGQHVTKDIPALVEQCRDQHPQIKIEVLPTLENDPGVEEIVSERIAPFVESATDLPAEGPAIQQRSFQIIESRLAGMEFASAAEKDIVRRIVHSTADFSFARSLRFHPEAIDRGLDAIHSGRPIFCDVAMVQAGITLAGRPAICAISDPDVIRAAEQQHCTRAAAAMEKFGDQLQGAIVAVGNAPTALWTLMDMAKRGGPRPAVVVGLPVGFVGARESKLALLKSDLCYITNTSARGGSPVAAAAVNALGILARERKPIHV